MGNEDNAFLEAWKLNVENQNLILINNNTLAQLIIEYVLNERAEIEFEIEPQELLNVLKIYAINHGISYDKYLPQNPSWLSRPINSICNDLVEIQISGESINDSQVSRK